MISITSLFNLALWPMQKMNGSWKMTLDGHEQNHMITLNVAAVPHTLSVLEQIMQLLKYICYIY